MNRGNNNKKIAFAASLLLIFAIHFVNINFFYHSHKVNGIKIIHSHFHENTHSTEGVHSATELRIISEFSKLQTLAMAFVIFALAFLILFGVINYRFISHKVLEEQFSTKSPRAPPAFV